MNIHDRPYIWSFLTSRAPLLVWLKTSIHPFISRSISPSSRLKTCNLWTIRSHQAKKRKKIFFQLIWNISQQLCEESHRYNYTVIVIPCTANTLIKVHRKVVPEGGTSNCEFYNSRLKPLFCSLSLQKLRPDIKVVARFKILNLTSVDLFTPRPALLPDLLSALSSRYWWSSSCGSQAEVHQAECAGSRYNEDLSACLPEQYWSRSEQRGAGAGGVAHFLFASSLPTLSQPNDLQ